VNSPDRIGIMAANARGLTAVTALNRALPLLADGAGRLGGQV